MSEEEFREWIEASLKEYKEKESTYFSFSRKNAIFNRIIELAENNNLSMSMFKTFCKLLSIRNMINTFFLTDGVLSFNPSIEYNMRTNMELIYERVFKAIWSNLRAQNQNFLEEYVKDFFIRKGVNDDKKIENKLNRFIQLWKIDGIIDNEYFKDIYDLFSIDKLVRIRASDFLRSIIKKNEDTPNREFLNSIIDYMVSRDIDIEVMTRTIKAIKNYNYKEKEKTSEDSNQIIIQGAYLPDILENSTLFDKLVQIMMNDPNNLFLINTIEDIENYERIRKGVCFDYLFKKGAFPEWKRQKYALLELLYGLNFEQAESLVIKYGKDIDRIEPKSPEEQVLVDYINSLKHIFSLDEKTIENMIQNPEFITFLKNSEPPKIASGYVIEKDIASMFEREFNEKIASSSPPIIEGKIRYDNTDILVEILSPIDKDGNFIYTEYAISVREEGSLEIKWNAPQDYVDYYNRKSTKYLLNSESIITQSQNAHLNFKDSPKVGYLEIVNLIMMAPFIIASRSSANDISPINLEYYTGNGIEFRVLEELINYTRIGIGTEIEFKVNELACDRLENIDEKGIKKRLPDRAVYFQKYFEEISELRKLKGIQLNEYAKEILQEVEKLEELTEEKNNEWTETLRLAKEMQIPLRVIDEEGFAIQEEMVIEYDLALLGKEEFDEEKWKVIIEGITGKECKSIKWDRKPELSHEGLIREIIIRFENNVQGIQHSRLKDRYFTDEKRKSVIESLLQAIEVNREKNPKQYIEDLLTIEEVIAEEKSKEQTNTGATIYKISNAYMELEQKIEEYLVQINERNSLIELGDLDILNHVIDFVYKSELYDDNELHSTDHITKVVLFSDILSQKEGLDGRDRLLLLISASLHDCGREGQDGFLPHAILSAEKAGEMLRKEDSPFKKYNLTEDEIKMIQTVIEYHEVKEIYLGKLEIGEELSDSDRNELKPDSSIIGLMSKNQLDREEFLSRTSRLCELLKDADALDRDRIPNPNEMTNICFLHTKSAKNIRMLTFANRLNDRTAKKLLEKYYGEKYEGDDGVYKLLENRELDLKLKIDRKMQCLTKEEMFEVFNEMGIDLGVENGIYIANKQEEMNESERAKINFVREQYINYELSEDTIRQAIELIMGDFQKIKKDEEEISA